MNILALETATEQCSVALWCAGRVLALSEHAPRQHGERLLPMIEQVLAQAGIGRTQIDAIACGRGPGAFTGVRLAIAVSQGLALALDRPVLPVSTLAALALAAPLPDLPVLAVLDARMGEVYAAAYTRSAADALQPLSDEWLGSAAALSVPAAPAWQGVGSGWTVAEAALRARVANVQAVDAGALPEAAAVARLAAPLLAAGGGIAAQDLQPVYLRDKVALTRAERGLP